MKYNLKHFFDEDTGTLTYLVYDQETKDSVIIDPILNYDPASSLVSYDSVKELISYIDSKNLKVHCILETHIHADHISGSNFLKKKYSNAKICISSSIKEVQAYFSKMFNLSDSKNDGSPFDILLKDEDILEAGNMKIKVLLTPGHTPACTSYLIGNRLFTGDALFMPDTGTGRCDFPGGSATELYNSIHQKIYKLADSIQVYTGHDYKKGGRALCFESTLGKQKEENILLKKSTSLEEFVELRNKRDESLNAPKLLLQSVQVNINAGEFHKEEANGISYLKIPVSYC